MNVDNVGARITKLETQVSGLALNVEAFVEESREYRNAQSSREREVWQAIKDQGNQSRITWPMIVITITMLMGLLVLAGRIAVAFTDLRFQHQATINEWLRADVERLEKDVERVPVGN